MNESTGIRVVGGEFLILLKPRHLDALLKTMFGDQTAEVREKRPITEEDERPRGW